MDYNLVVCGGTFDHFHKGHESLLRLAFASGKKVVVGVTSDQYVRSSKIETGSLKEIEKFEERKQSVLEFLTKEKVSERVEIIEINDLFGPTLSRDLVIDAIVVSDDTKKGGEIISQKRKELGLEELIILIAPQVLAEDGKLISSTRIRNGEINREGKLYVKPIWLEKDLILPEDLRAELHEPFGKLLLDSGNLVKSNNLVITVGDITTKIFNEKNLGQNLSVIDFKVERERRFSNLSELGFLNKKNIINAINPAGFITKDLFKKLAEIFKEGINEIILQVSGEEDLAVLPLILLAPLGTIIYYGQPGQGLVEVRVSGEAKNKAYNFVLRLKQG